MEGMNDTTSCEGRVTDDAHDAIVNLIYRVDQLLSAPDLGTAAERLVAVSNANSDARSWFKAHWDERGDWIEGSDGDNGDCPVQPELALYEYTMTNPDTDLGWSSGFVRAPHDEAAVAFAASWPTANGWPTGTKWSVARVAALLTVDENGQPCTGSAMISTIADGVTS